MRWRPRCLNISPVTDDVIEALRQVVGEANVLLGEEALEPYTHDETVGLRADPEVVVKVTSAEQVSRVLMLAQRERIPVTPRGAGYGLSGGAVALHGGIVLSTEKMNRILEIDHENLMVTVEPGVITGEIHRAVEDEGLFYPPDPASLDSCTIGGNVSEGAGGPRAVKYGITKDYVTGLEAVLPSGQIITMGGKLVKNVTGYSLIQLLIGSEGTLAVVTKIILRLIPLPKVQVDLLVPFDDFQAAADTVSEIIAHRILPTTIEFMEQDSMLAVERLLQKPVPFADAAAQLLIQLDGNLQEAVEAEMEDGGRHLPGEWGAGRAGGPGPPHPGAAVGSAAHDHRRPQPGEPGQSYGGRGGAPGRDPSLAEGDQRDWEAPWGAHHQLWARGRRERARERPQGPDR